MDGSAELFHQFYLSKYTERELNYLSRLSLDTQLASELRMTKGKGEIASFYKRAFEAMLAERALGDTGRIPFLPFIPAP
jgi:hypothetical protein